MHPEESNNRNLGPLLIILVVVIVAVLGYKVRQNGWASLTSFVTGGQMPLHVEEEVSGEVVKGFPVEFISLAKDAVVIESMKLTGGGDTAGMDVFRVVYTTGADIPTLFAAYVNFLNERGYAVTNTKSQGGESSISAVGNNEKVAIVLSLQSASMLEVTIDVAKPKTA